MQNDELRALAKEALGKGQGFYLNLSLKKTHQLAQGVLDLIGQSNELDKAYHVWKAKHRKREEEIERQRVEILRLKREVNTWAKRYDFNYMIRIPYPEVEEEG